jgi:hypothetical protein
MTGAGITFTQRAHGRTGFADLVKKTTVVAQAAVEAAARR